MFHGWYQVAFERELEGQITPARIGQLPLMLVRDGARIEAFDAVCPHRGAHLAYGGRLDGGDVICPFHGHRIGLGEGACGDFKVRGYRTLEIGGLIFVLLDENLDRGFGAFAKDLDETHFLVQGFTMVVKTKPELVIENGFDRAHFTAVHGLAATPDLCLGTSRDGELVVEAVFQSPEPVDWLAGTGGAGATQFGFTAHVYSPNLCATRLEKDGRGSWVISGATPSADGECTIRVSVAAPAGVDGTAPDQQAIRSLLRDSKLAYTQDAAIWENLFTDAPSRLTSDDELVSVFRDFCRAFSGGDSP